MKIALALCLSLAGTWIGGCAVGGSGTDPHMQVVVEGGGPFPAALAGRWESDRDGWQFVIEPDGKISSAVISFGRVQVKPGQITTVPALAGGKAIFEPGRWIVHYIPSTCDLTINITMDHVHVDTGDNIIDGRSTDTFLGKLLPNEELWSVQWTTFSHYTTHTTGKPSAEISTDPDKGETKPLLFKKVKTVSGGGHPHCFACWYSKYSMY
jgi:hypothetical protein